LAVSIAEQYVVRTCVDVEWEERLGEADDDDVVDWICPSRVSYRVSYDLRDPQRVYNKAIDKNDRGDRLDYPVDKEHRQDWEYD